MVLCKRDFYICLIKTVLALHSFKIAYLAVMKFWINFALLYLIICTTAQSQSYTLEISPTFQKNKLEHFTEIIDFNPSFDGISFVGISAYHFDEDYKNISYRLLHNGKWSTWKTFSPQHELADKVRTAYEGQLITSAFSAIQFKTPDHLSTNLTVRFFIGKRQNLIDTSPQKSILCAELDVCDRLCWCLDCPIDTTPQLTTPTHIIVHHSAGSNQTNINYSEVVNYIWDLHVNTNGWDDIGYNWLIDPNGILYEGRPDGYQGAHFSCINENTVGICLLGDFTLISPTEEAVNTLVNLVAFEATAHQIDVLSESYHDTGAFFLENVAGHRDSSGSANSCSTTACPGDTFYPMLDSIRIKVAALECYQNSISSTQTLDHPSWSVFPNPFQNTLNITHKGFGNSKIEIRDIKGQSYGTLFTGQVHDLSHLANGVYFLIHEGQVIKKVIKHQ